MHKNLEFQIFSDTHEYFENLNKSKFVISPEGNGLDTHRIWEALILDTLPIMLKTGFSKNLKDLGVPGLYLNSWEELLSYDTNKLDEIYERETRKSFLHLTQLKYWEEKIKNYKEI